MTPAIARKFTLSAKERLKSRKLIGQLFRAGKAFSVFPLRVIYMRVNGSPGVQAGFSVGTRNFKKALDRNPIKRVMREAFPLEKPFLHDGAEPGSQLHVFFVYTAREMAESKQVPAAMQAALIKLKKKWHEPAS